MWGIGKGQQDVGAMRAAVFIERDGLLVERVRETGGTPRRWEEFVVRESAIQAVRRLQGAGFAVFATTNQPGVTLGEPTRGDLDRMHAVLRARMDLEEVLFCPHATDDPCTCRKPSPGLLVEAARGHRLDLARSFVLGDHWSDAEMAEAAGAMSVLIRSGSNGNGHHDAVVDDLEAAVGKVLEVAQSWNGHPVKTSAPSRARRKG